MQKAKIHMAQKIAFIAASAMGLLLAGSLAFTSGLRFGDSTDAFADCRKGAAAGSIGGPFTLQNKNGQTVTETDVIANPSLIYFGYTFCPDVCPYDVARNADAVDLLEERGILATPIFISIDPARDTPKQVGEFAANIHERMIGLTGSPEQVRAASKAYRTYYSKQEGDPDYYLVDHSTFTYLVLPETGFVQYFRRDVTPEDMAQTVACFVKAAQ